MLAMTDLHTPVSGVSSHWIFVVGETVAGDDWALPDASSSSSSSSSSSPDKHSLAPRVVAAGVGFARVPLQLLALARVILSKKVEENKIFEQKIE